MCGGGGFFGYASPSSIVVGVRFSHFEYFSRTAEDNRMETRVLKFVGRIFALVSLGIMLPVAMLGQSAPAAHGVSNDMPSRLDIFAGYSYLAPRGTVQVLQTERHDRRLFLRRRERGRDRQRRLFLQSLCRHSGGIWHPRVGRPETQTQQHRHRGKRRWFSDG